MPTKKKAKKPAKKAAKKKTGKFKSAMSGKFIKADAAKDNPYSTYRMKPKRAKTVNMDFGDALRALRAGKAVSRKGWNNDSISVHIQQPDRNSKMTESYLYMEKWDNEGMLRRFPLDLSCESVLANDWFIKK